MQCEEELGLLRDQLMETQRMLYDTQQRLQAEEQHRNQVSASRHTAVTSRCVMGITTR